MAYYQILAVHARFSGAQNDFKKLNSLIFLLRIFIWWR